MKEFKDIEELQDFICIMCEEMIQHICNMLTRNYIESDTQIDLSLLILIALVRGALDSLVHCCLKQPEYKNENAESIKVIEKTDVNLDKIATAIAKHVLNLKEGK
jgi:hypothetical protein